MDSALVVEVPALLPSVRRGAILLVETALVPTLLIAVLLHTAGLVLGLICALGWCYLALAVRYLASRRMPGTLLLCTAMISGRTVVALATSSAVVYLMQPVLGSILMALVFLGSAAVGRPITLRLARDFVSLPSAVLGRRGVRRMFTQVALLWGLSRLIDAAMSLGFLHWNVDAALISRGLISPLLTAVTIGICAAWGWRALRRDGVRLHIRRHAAIATA